MKCPACANHLTQITAGKITVDACEGGCGGMWFDRFELQKVDEAHEPAGEVLLHVQRNPQIKVNQTQKRHCPKCENIVMMQHFFSVKRQVLVDECPNCGGYWLDAGELAAIRHQFNSEEARNKAAQEYFSEIADRHLAEMRSHSEQKAEKAHEVARMFRFICPSYYIPGKQDWGAF